MLSLSRPIRVTDQSCLACHSTPAAAPPTMVDLYGTANGFGWKLGETVGAQIVSVPMRVPLDRARNTFIVVMGGLAAVFIVMMVAAQPAAAFRHHPPGAPDRRRSPSEVSLGDMPSPGVPGARPRRDRLAGAKSFNRMRRSLANAMKMLEE